MNSWKAIRLITGREIRERSRSKAFLISSAVTFLLVLAVTVLPAVLGGRTTTHEVGVVGVGNEAIVAAARAVIELDDADEELALTTYPDASAARAALAAGEADAVLVDGSLLLVQRSGGFFGSRIQSLLQQAAASVRIDDLLEDPGSADVLALLASEPLTVESLSGENADETGSRAIIAYGGMILMYVAVLTYGAWTLTGVTEEKSSRVVEVLLATVAPRHLLAGKVLGIGVLGLAQFVLTIGIAVTGIQVTGSLDLPELPIDSVVMLSVWFVLGYALFSIAYGAAGALATAAEDAQSSAMPLTLVAVVGFLASFQALEDPEGRLAIITTYVPVTAPFVVPLRVALAAIAWWEVMISILVAILTIAALVRFGGRVYAGGLLKTGGRVGWKDAFRSSEL